MRVTGYEQVASAIRVYSMPRPGPLSCGLICVSMIWICTRRQHLLSTSCNHALWGSIQSYEDLPNSSPVPFSQHCCHSKWDICTSRMQTQPMVPDNLNSSVVGPRDLRMLPRSSSSSPGAGSVRAPEGNLTALL
jgi:hypothetical protein